jgi:hypothetical protein
MAQPKLKERLGLGSWWCQLPQQLNNCRIYTCVFKSLCSVNTFHHIFKYFQPHIAKTTGGKTVLGKWLQFCHVQQM